MSNFLFQYKDFLYQFSMLLLLNIGFIAVIRTFKYKFQEIRAAHGMVYAEYCLIVVISLVSALVFQLNNPWLTGILLGLYILAYLLLTIDCILTGEYGYVLNLSTLKLFLEARENITESAGFSMGEFIKALKVYLAPVYFAIAIILFAVSPNVLYFYLPILLAYCIYSITQSRLGHKWKLAPLWVLVVLILFAGFYWVNDLFPQLPWPIIDFAAICFLLSLISLWTFKKHLSDNSNKLFYIMPTLLMDIFYPRTFKNNARIQMKPEHEKLIEQKRYHQEKTEHFNLLDRCNVIMICLESVGFPHMQPYSETGMKLHWYEELKQGWSSNYHVCITPNTNTAFHTLYSGSYQDSEQYPFLESLHKQDYASVFIDNSELGAGTHELLEKIGFEHILSSRDCPDKHVFDEDFLYAMLPAIKEKINQKSKFYLHIKNVQTHMPYRAKGEVIHDDKQRYIRSAEQYDAAIKGIVAKLGETVDLDNTLIVYTSDHGQAFGEWAYRAHSNAVIKEEVNVPFAMNHPKLSTREVEFSSHFDIFPSILDLLGIEYKYAVEGLPLLSKNRGFSHILYSKTYKGKMPSCFGYIDEKEKWMIDLVFQRFLILDHHDNIKRHMDKTEKLYYQQFFWRALSERGLIQ